MAEVVGTGPEHRKVVRIEIRSVWRFLRYLSSSSSIVNISIKGVYGMIRDCDFSGVQHIPRFDRGFFISSLIYEQTVSHVIQDIKFTILGDLS